MRIVMERQKDINDCGIASMSSIIKYYKGNIPYDELLKITEKTSNGISAYEIKRVLTNIGFKVEVYKIDDIKKITKFPLIAHTNEKGYHHYIVVYKIKNNKVIIMDPKDKIKKLTLKEFEDIFTNKIIEITKIRQIPNIKKENKIKNIIKQNNLKKITIIALILAILNITTTLLIKYANHKQILIILSIIIILKTLFTYYKNNVTIKIAEKINTSLIKETIDHIISLPYLYFKNRSISDLMTKILDLQNIKEYILEKANNEIIDKITIILILLVTLNKDLFPILIIILIINIILIKKDKKEEYIEELIHSKIRLNKALQETINSYTLIKGLNIKDKYLKRLNKKIEDYNKKEKKLLKNINNKELLKEVVISIGYIIIFAKYNYSIGHLITNVMIYNLFINSIKNLNETDYLKKRALKSIESIEEILNIKKEEEVKTKEDIKEIRIKNLNFTLNEKEILNNININIKKEDRIYIKGQNKVGKSTIAKLLMKYYTPNKNQIIINEKDILDINNIRENINYISSDEYLFEGTKEENLIMEDEEIYNENTKIIEENGYNLSLGEKQKIIIEKALIENSEIIILDEATSHMDKTNERQILEDLIKRKKTIIFISHKNDNEDLFNKIIKIKEGGKSEYIKYE